MEAEPAATKGSAFTGTAPPGPPEAVAVDGTLAGGLFTGIAFATTSAEADPSASKKKAAGAAEASTDHSSSKLSSRAAEAPAEADQSEGREHNEEGAGNLCARAA